jgi:hypothetical protein
MSADNEEIEDAAAERSMERAEQAIADGHNTWALIHLAWAIIYTLRAGRR